MRVVAVDAAAGGLRASSVALSVAEARVDPGFSVQTPFAPPRPPNLAASVPLEFSVAFSQDDCTRSPVLFAALQECLREVVREGASAAIGELLPREKLTVNLRSVESLQAGKVVLVADATTLCRAWNTDRPVKQSHRCILQAWNTDRSSCEPIKSLHSSGLECKLFRRPITLLHSPGLEYRQIIL